MKKEIEVIPWWERYPWNDQKTFPHIHDKSEWMHRTLDDYFKVVLEPNSAETKRFFESYILPQEMSIKIIPGIAAKLRTKDLISLQGFDKKLQSKIDRFNKKDPVKSSIVEFLNPLGALTQGYVLYASAICDCIKVLIQPIPDGPTTWVPISNIMIRPPIRKHKRNHE